MKNAPPMSRHEHLTLKRELPTLGQVPVLTFSRAARVSGGEDMNLNGVLIGSEDPNV